MVSICGAKLHGLQTLQAKFLRQPAPCSQAQTKQ